MSHPVDSSLTRLERRLAEACDDLWDSFVDPAEAYLDARGQRWSPLGDGGGGPACGAYFHEAQLREIREHCRLLAVTNEFAINGHENRISYIVGTGHIYRAAPRKGEPVDHELVAATQRFLDEFLAENSWPRRQAEIVRRLDRDGEAFLRLFFAPDGMTRIRFVEPDQVATPPSRAADPAASHGVWTEPADVERPIAYFIDGQPVPAADVQHRKANVDGNVKRGLPLFYPVRKNLRRAEKLLRNMSVLSEVQSAIALIRKHRGASRTAVQQFVAGQADATATSPTSGKTTTWRRFAPGTILDAAGDVDYDFPAASIDAGAYVTVLQAELRAIAARLVMPEFMLTSDASNANFASTLAAVGPAVRMFQRLQGELIGSDRELLGRALAHAAAAGRLPAAAVARVELQIAAPSVHVRDRLAEAQARRIEFAAGVLSPQTWAQLSGLDYAQERTNLAQHEAAPAAARNS